MPDGDTIWFIPITNNINYYNNIEIKSIIKNNRFVIENNFDYPQMYQIRFSSETGIRPLRSMLYILDKGVKSIEIDSFDNRSKYFNKSQKELLNKYFPEVERVMQKENNLYLSRFVRSLELMSYENFLYEYILKNSESSVALWMLIKHFSENGHSARIEMCNKAFSFKIKKLKAWKELSLNLERIKIKEKLLFPSLLLQDTSLKSIVLDINNGKYTLINFWFSNCKPCLEKIPTLQELYNKYSNKNFEIIHIATDRIEKLENLKKVLAKYDLKWPQFYDKNGKIASENNIFFYPTNFLLDQNGVLIIKNISTSDLINFLEK